MTKYRVRYYKSEGTESRYSIAVEAASPEAAMERVEACFTGADDFTQDEYESEMHEKELDSDGTSFVGLCTDDYDAPTLED